MNCELPDVQAVFRKGKGTRDQIANICWILEKGREFQKNISFCFIDSAKTFDCADHNKLENSERDGNTRPPDLPLEKSVCGQEAIVRTGHGTTDWFQIGKGVHQGLHIITLPIYLICRLHFWGAPKSVQMVSAAMKSKDACSLAYKLWPTQKTY